MQSTWAARQRVNGHTTVDAPDVTTPVSVLDIDF